MENEKTKTDEDGESNHFITRQILIGKIRQYAESLKENSNEKKKDPLNGIVDECIIALNRLSKSTPPDKSHNLPKRPSTKLKEKEFVARNSLLSDLFEIEHFRTIRNIFTAVLVILFVNNIIEEFYNNTGTKLQLITWNFNTLDKAFIIWISMLASTFILVHKMFQLWAYKAMSYGSVWNRLWLAMYVLYLIAFFHYPTKYLLIYNLTPVCSMIVVAEQLRMMMKTHSFVRHNAAKVFEMKEKPNSKPCPEMSKYLYFLFAPTLLYRDEYPRTSHIRIRFVITNFCQVIGCIYYVSTVLIDHFLVFRDFGLSTCTSKQVIRSIIAGMVPGTMLFFCANFLLLHSWMNAFAELLRFADRQFYTDWWNSYNFAMYYRTWNIVVHDWLYTYVFRDLAMILTTNRVIPLSGVFLISSVMHDYVMSFVFRFVLPVYLVMFGGIGGLLFFVPQKGNRQNLSVLFWTGVIIGTSIMTSIFSIEWYARQNCPPFTDTYLDLFVPRMWVCYRNVSKSS